MNDSSVNEHVIRVPYGDDESQFGDLRVPQGPGPHPVLIVIHGGFWYDSYGLDLMDAMCEDLTGRGYATWNIEYRRVGQPGGGWPGTLTDVGMAVDKLRDLDGLHHLDLKRMTTIGHSAGGHLALWVAGRHKLARESRFWTGNRMLPVQAAVSLAGVSDLGLMWELRQENSPVVDFLGGTPTEVPDRYAEASPIQLLPLGVPQVLIHGTEDDRVPCLISDTYYAVAMEYGDPVAYIELPEIEHFKVIDPASEAWGPILDALNELKLHFS